MIERYTLPQMAQLWSEESAWGALLEVEIVASEVMAELGLIPQEAAQAIREKATFSVERIHEIEARNHHDIIAFLEAVSENLGEEARYLHLGLTSNDAKDTATALLLKEASDLILKEMESLLDVLCQRARQHKDILMVGRTHGIHAEPITFGLKLAVWVEEIRRQRKRMREAREEIAVGQLSGAVGTYANVDPRVEPLVCERLGLRLAPISTQVLQRDRHAFFLSVLANIACSLDKFATELRNLQRTDILEVEEAFAREQKGSSAMPHKKNPISSEQISGLARIVRSHALAAFENVPLWHERDISHSSAERVIFPDSTTLVHYMLRQMTRVLGELIVHSERMQENLDRTHGLVFSQRLMLALVDKGIPRDQAYRAVQANALRTWKEGIPLLQLSRQDPLLSQHLSSEELEALFRYENFLTHVDLIFQRLGLLDKE